MYGQCMGEAFGRGSVVVSVIAPGNARRVEDHCPALPAGVCSVVTADRRARQRPDEYAPRPEPVAASAPHRRRLGHAAGDRVELRRI